MNAAAAALVAGMLLTGSLALAADPTAGKLRAAQCAACHGADGMAVMPDAPHLAGQNEVYLVKALRDYRSGARRHEQMTLMARSLTDVDIANLATYYSRLATCRAHPAPD